MDIMAVIFFVIVGWVAIEAFIKPTIELISHELKGEEYRSAWFGGPGGWAKK